MPALQRALLIDNESGSLPITGDPVEWNGGPALFLFYFDSLTGGGGELGPRLDVDLDGSGKWARVVLDTAQAVPGWHSVELPKCNIRARAAGNAASVTNLTVVLQGYEGALNVPLTSGAGL